MNKYLALPLLLLSFAMLVASLFASCSTLALSRDGLVIQRGDSSYLFAYPQQVISQK